MRHGLLLAGAAADAARCLLLLVLVGSLVACTGGAPVDPDAMGQAAGKRAGQFYENVTVLRLPEAAVYFSARVRDKYPDPLQEPLVKQRAENRFVNAIPRLDRVDWRDQVVYFKVTLHVPTTAPGGVSALQIYETRIDRWVYEGDDWYYDGHSPE